MATPGGPGRRIVAGLAVLALFILIVGSCDGDETDQPSASPPTPSAVPRPSACPGGYGQTGTYSAQGGCHVDGERVTIAGVHDAATYVLSDGRRVRLAGVIVQAADTCGGGAALRLVGTRISAGQVVNIVRNAGAGLDPFGSHWVHIQLGPSSTDLGTLLATYGYAEAYPGGGASTSYVQGLAATVDAAKSARLGQFGPPCTVPPPPVVAAPPTPEEHAQPPVRAPAPRATRNDENDENDEDDPTPPKRRTGNSGHPCLPGERDGDGDGYCGEGR